MNQQEKSSEEAMNIQWVFDVDRMTVGDVIKLQEGKMTDRIAVLAKCAYDAETDEPLDTDRVITYLHSLSIALMTKLVQAFAEATKQGTLDPN